MGRLRGLVDLVHDAIEKTTDLVERTHASTAQKPIAVLSLFEPIRGPVQAVGEAQRLIASAVYDSIRLTNSGVQKLESIGLSVAAPLATSAAEELAPGPPVDASVLEKLAFYRDTAQGALNAVVGDFLHERHNGLAIEMGLRHRGEWLTLEPSVLSELFADASDRLVVFVHGLACTELAWSFNAARYYEDAGVTFGTQLTRDLGFTPLYVRYNTGRHISENGRELDALLEALVKAYPKPVRELVLIGHSMGGLVSRSAAHYGDERGASWIESLSHVFCLGSPHLGAPLERATHALTSLLSAIPAAGARVPAEVINARSAGIKDLRFGYVLDEHWHGKDPDGRAEPPSEELSYVTGVRYCFVAGCSLPDPAHPLAELIGDLLVQVRSASGAIEEASEHVVFPIRVLAGVHHLELLDHPDVYAEILRVLAS